MSKLPLIDKPITPSAFELNQIKHASENSDDGLPIVNAFYSHQPGVSMDVFDQYWQRKICELAVRIVAAEKRVRKLEAKHGSETKSCRSER